jgi:hypothetical protein
MLVVLGHEREAILSMATEGLPPETIDRVVEALIHIKTNVLNGLRARERCPTPQEDR